MKIIETGFVGLLIIELDVYRDGRGYFCETFNLEKFREMGLPYEFVQDNQSYSKQNVIRGLHYQVEPYEQGKLVRVSRGRIIDVAVDIRKDSKTYRQHFKCELSEDNFRVLWIPPGFAHGFGVLSDDAIVHYKCTMPYSKEHERVIRWDESELGIEWGIEEPVVSEKDGTRTTRIGRMTTDKKSFIHGLGEDGTRATRIGRMTTDKKSFIHGFGGRWNTDDTD